MIKVTLQSNNELCFNIFVGNDVFIFNFKDNEIIKNQAYSIKMFKQFKESN